MVINMEFNYKTKDTCSTNIKLELEGNIVRNITLFAVLIYEIVGPFLTKIALTKAGDIKEEGKTNAREEALRTIELKTK